jgi:hypothetical protein
MVNVSVSLPEHLKDLIEAKVQEGGYGNSGTGSVEWDFPAVTLVRQKYSRSKGESSKTRNHKVVSAFSHTAEPVHSLLNYRYIDHFRNHTLAH